MKTNGLAKLLRLVVLAITALLLSTAAFAADDEQPSIAIKGRVLDEHNRPVAGARIELKDKDNAERSSTHSGRDGAFEIPHKASGLASLVVMPPDGSNLTQAVLNNLTASESQNYIVKLKRGFTIHGRIVSGDGKGLKNMRIKIAATGAGSGDDTIHSGAEVITSRSGIFSVVLTPGKKVLEISDYTHPDIVPKWRVTINVTRDTKVADIVMPNRKEDGVP